MTDTPTAKPDPYAALRGGVTVPVEFRDGARGSVWIRECTPHDVLKGNYVDHLREDYDQVLETMGTCSLEDGSTVDAGWVGALTRDSYTALREAEDALNFAFALGEIKAAHARGQKLKFVDEAIRETSEQLLKMMASVTSSANTAASRDPRRRKPVASPSAG